MLLVLLLPIPFRVIAAVVVVFADGMGGGGGWLVAYGDCERPFRLAWALRAAEMAWTPDFCPGLVIVTGTIPLVPGGGLWRAANRAWMSQYNLSFRLKYPWFLSDDPQVAHLKQSACRFLSLMRTNTPTMRRSQEEQMF